MPEVKNVVVRSVTFLPIGDVEIEYLLIDELRDSGVVLTHRVIVPSTSAYAEDIENLHDSVSNIVVDALDHHANTPPMNVEDINPDDDEDEDDDDE